MRVGGRVGGTLIIMKRFLSARGYAWEFQRMVSE